MEIFGFIALFLLTMLPFFELRASIPYGIWSGSVSLPFGLSLSGLGLSPLIVFPFVVIANILLGEFIFWSLKALLPHVLKVPHMERVYGFSVKRAQKKAQKYVERYGKIGLALFIGIPFPGSGVWSGALAAFIFGFRLKEFRAANIAGVIIAGILVTLATVWGIRIFSF
jgi:uncharacterized membrane protein